MDLYHNKELVLLVLASLKMLCSFISEIGVTLADDNVGVDVI